MTRLAITVPAAILGIIVLMVGSRSLRTPSPALVPEIGDNLCIPISQASFDTSQRIIVIADKRGCAACDSNQLFEEALYSESLKTGLPVLYWIPPDQDQDENEAELKTMGRHVIRLSGATLGVAGYPSIFGLRRNLTIDSEALGAVQHGDAGRVMDGLINGNMPKAYTRLSRRDFERLAGGDPRFQYVTLAEKTSSSHAEFMPVYIPLAELTIRAGYELAHGEPTYVDCDGVAPKACQYALLALGPRFPRLYAVDLAATGFQEGCRRL